LYPLLKLSKKLVGMGYERVTAVEGKGQFSIRGGILDIFPLTADNPYRIEFFDDEVDSIRIFDVLSQRSVENHPTVTIPPARELVLKDDIAARGGDSIRKSYAAFVKKIGHRNVSGLLHEKVHRVLDRLNEGIYDTALEGYFCFFYPERSTVFEYLDTSSLVVLDEPARIRERCLEYSDGWQEYFKELLPKGEVLPEQSEVVLDYSEFLAKLSKHIALILQVLPTPHPDFEPKVAYSLAARGIPSYNGRIQLLAEDIGLWQKKGYSILLLTGSQNRGEGLASFLREHAIEPVLKENIEGDIKPGQVAVLPGILSHGFEYHDARFAVVSDKEIYGTQKRRTQPRKKPRRLDVFTELKVGDYVVHENHGIGKLTFFPTFPSPT